VRGGVGEERRGNKEGWGGREREIRKGRDRSKDGDGERKRLGKGYREKGGRDKYGGERK
jgi:hypothetical protein